MTLYEDVKDLNKRLEVVEEVNKVRKKPKEKKMTIKIPAFLLRSAQRDENVSVALVLGSNHTAKFKKCVYKDGIFWVGPRAYTYDASAIYRYKKTSFVVVFEWRLTPVGGKTEANSVLVSEKKSMKDAEEKNLTNYGQETIIRALQQALIDQRQKGGFKMGIWVVILAGLVLYVISQFFGG